MESKGAHAPGHDVPAVLLQGPGHAHDATAGSHGPEVTAADGRDRSRRSLLRPRRRIRLGEVIRDPEPAHRMLASPPVLLLECNEFWGLSDYAVTVVLTYFEQPLAQRRPALSLREAGRVESLPSRYAELAARVAEGEELLGRQVLQHRRELI